MTSQAHIARDIALKFEGKLDRLSRNQDGTIKITLTIHPNEFPAQLMTDPLGQRYVCAMAAIGDDEQPKVSAPGLASGTRVTAEESSPPPVNSKPAKRWEELPYPTRAALLCQDRDFQRWLELDHPAARYSGAPDDEAIAAMLLREKCGVSSRSELKTDTAAQAKFNAIHASFVSWRNHGVR